MPHSQDYFGPYFNKKGLKIPARIISILFHPIFVTFGTAMLIYWLQKPAYISVQNAYPLWIGFLFLNLVMFPLVATLLMKALGFISSITMKNPKDRIIPLIATMIFYFWAYNVAKNISPEVPLYMRVYLLGSFWGIIMIFLINIFFKVSMHTTAIASTVGILIMMILQLKIDILWIIIASIVLAGLVGTARLILKEHLPFELVLGYITGFLVQVGAYYFLIN
ncbi:MAG: hypothetical protein KL787_06160 [Taibaiella sp.]|nr:hypothetical protein [Taibaiella sp.]